MKSPVAKRSVVINGHKTSVSLEDAFWSAAKEIAAERGLTLSELIAMVDHDRGERGNLSSARSAESSTASSRLGVACFRA